MSIPIPGYSCLSKSILLNYSTAKPLLLTGYSCLSKSILLNSWPAYTTK